MQSNAVAPGYPQSNSNQAAQVNAPKKAKITTQLEQGEVASKDPVLPKCEGGSAPSISQPKSLMQRCLEVSHPQICEMWSHKLKTTFLVEETSLEASSLQEEKTQLPPPDVGDFIIFELPKQQAEFSFGCACEAVSKLSLKEKEAYFTACLDQFQDTHTPRTDTDDEHAKDTLQDQIGVLAKAALRLGINTDQSVEELDEEAQFKVLWQVVEPSFSKCLEELKENSANDPMIQEACETLISYLGNLLCLKPAGTMLLESPEFAVFATKLARVLKGSGNIKQAKEILERALSIKERHYGKQHPEVGFTLVDLAATAQALGDTQEAQELIKRAVTIQKRHYGREHPIYATTLVNMVDVLGRQCDAKKLLERARPILEGQYDSNPINVARVLIGLARFGKVDMEQAKILLERGLSILRSSYRKDDPWMYSTLDNVFVSIRALDNLQEQKELWERALVIEERHYGTDHIEVALTLGNLANAIHKLGDAKEAKMLYERALSIKERHYGTDHIKLAVTISNLAATLGKLGDAKEAKVLYERALRIEEDHYGIRHIEVAKTSNNLAAAMRDLGNTKEARVLYEHALRIEEDHYGADHVEVATTLNNLGTVISELGDAKEAKALYERALRIEERYYGTEHIELATTLGNLGTALFDLGNAKEAKALYERALSIEERHYGIDDIEVVTTLVHLSAAIRDLGDFKEANRLLERVLTIKERHYGADDILVASTLLTLAQFIKENDVERAKVLLERALIIQQSHYGLDHPDVAATLANIVEVNELETGK